VHKATTFGDVWTVIKPFSDKIKQLDSLTISLQDVLAKANCSRQIGFILNPLRIILYAANLKNISFESLQRFRSKQGFYSFVIYEQDEKLAFINPEKESFSHGLISGVTGSGKSVMLKAFILSLAQSSNPDDTRFFILNPKNSDFGNYKNLPHVDEYVIAPEAITQVLQKLKALTSERLVSGVKTPKLFVFVDELSLIEDKDTLTEIANIGRSLGVQLIVATQRPTADTIPTKLRSQLTYSLTGRVTNSNEARIVSGQSNSGAHLLKASGLFIFNAPGYLNVLVQGLFLENDQKIIDQLIEQYPKTQKIEVITDPWLNAPKPVLSRKDWILTLQKGEYKQVDLQRSHMEFYQKNLNANTAKGILKWLLEYWDL